MSLLDRIKKLFGYSEPAQNFKPEQPTASPGFNSCHDCPMGMGTKKVQLPNGDLMYLCERHYELRHRN
jgi:hypothetical protein